MSEFVLDEVVPAARWGDLIPGCVLEIHLRKSGTMTDELENPSGADILRLKSMSLLGNQIRQVIYKDHPDSRQIFLHQMAEQLRPENLPDMEQRYLSYRDRVKIAEITSAWVRDYDSHQKKQFSAEEQRVAQIVWDRIYPGIAWSQADDDARYPFLEIADQVLREVLG